MKKLKNRFKNIKPQTLLTHVIVTLLYPLARVVMASSRRLLIFTDCLTIVAAILLIAGVVYSLYLHGDFDISSYVMRRARSNAPKQTAEADDQQSNPMNNGFMKWFFPLFSLYICAGYNAAFAIYWMAANVIQVVQQLAVNWYFDRQDQKKALEEAAKETIE